MDSLFHSVIPFVLLVLIGFAFGYLLGRIKRCEGVCGIDDHKNL